MNEKKGLVKSFSGETVLRGDDFKRYVNSLRGKSNTYKKRRAGMNYIKTGLPGKLILSKSKRSSGSPILLK